MACYLLPPILSDMRRALPEIQVELESRQGGLLALGLILIDEVDNAYGDLYSGSVAGHSLKPGWSVRRWGMALAVLCIALALVLPMHSLEPFLLMLSSVFVPLYGVILARLAGHRNVVSLVTQRSVNTSAVVIWLLGVACYHLCAQLTPSWGAALPTLLLTFVLARLSRALPGSSPVSTATSR